MLAIFGFVLCLLAVADGVALLFGYSLTGVVYSPVVFLALGVLLCALEEPQRGNTLS